MSNQEGPGKGREQGVVGPSEGGSGGSSGRRVATRGPGRPSRNARTARPGGREYSGAERLLLLDTWRRSELPATDFSELVGVTPATLYAWRKRFEAEGPAGLMGYRKGQQGSRLPEHVRRAVLMMKEQHPDWGQDRIHDMLLRSQGVSVSARAVQRLLLESGLEVVSTPTQRNPEKPRRFERARPNQLWQTDLFSFQLKRQRRRLHLVGYMDDHSRFLVGFGLHASASGAMVREVFEASIANFGAPEEVLTDQGAQYHTWRGKSAFRKLCERRGIRQIVSRAKHPETLGKIERFWGTLYRELIRGTTFRDLEEARERIGLFIAWYNFQRTHQGIEGLVPADRYFQAAPEVREALQARVAENAKELALHGAPRKGLYLTGRMGDQPISLHSEGTKVVLTDPEGVREEVDLSAPGRRKDPEARAAEERAAEEQAPAELGPGQSELDEVLQDLAALDAELDEADAQAAVDAERAAEDHADVNESEAT